MRQLRSLNRLPRRSKLDHGVDVVCQSFGLWPERDVHRDGQWPVGTGTPTGTVQFKDNGNNLGAALALDASGHAQVSTATLTAATHTITVEYSGDTNFATSTGTLPAGQVVKPQPTLSINDVSLAEGDTGTTTMSFTVTLSAASSLTATVDFATANGTAIAPRLSGDEWHAHLQSRRFDEDD